MSALKRLTEAQCQQTIVDTAHRAGGLVHIEHTGMTAKGHHLTRVTAHPAGPT